MGPLSRYTTLSISANRAVSGQMNDILALTERGKEGMITSKEKSRGKKSWEVNGVEDMDL